QSPALTLWTFTRTYPLSNHCRLIQVIKSACGSYIPMQEEINDIAFLLHIIRPFEFQIRMRAPKKFAGNFHLHTLTSNCIFRFTHAFPIPSLGTFFNYCSLIGTEAIDHQVISLPTSSLVSVYVYK